MMEKKKREETKDKEIKKGKYAAHGQIASNLLSLCNVM